MSVKADTTGLEYQSAEWFEACAAIERARREGKAIQWVERGNDEAAWETCEYPDWDPDFDYRQPPVPREVWLSFERDGQPCDVFTSPRPEAIKFREVLE